MTICYQVSHLFLITIEDCRCLLVMAGRPME